MDAQERDIECKKYIKQWIQHNKSIDWKSSYPDLKTDEILDLIEYLMKINRKKLMDDVHNANKATKN